MKKLIITSTLVFLALVLGVAIQNHFSSPKKLDIKTNIVKATSQVSIAINDIIASPAVAAGPCITNAVIIFAPSANVLSFTVYDAHHCVYRSPTGMMYLGTCLVSGSCTNHYPDVPYAVAVLTPGICGPVTVGLISISCANGGSDIEPLTVPAGADAAYWTFSADCTGGPGGTCTVTPCLKAVAACGGQ